VEVCRNGNIQALRTPQDVPSGCEYWIVDPVDESIEIHRLEASGYVLTRRATGDDDVRSSVLPGAALRAGRIFP
jgi:Uma2 family endonuclease